MAKALKNVSPNSGKYPLGPTLMKVSVITECQNSLSF